MVEISVKIVIDAERDNPLGLTKMKHEELFSHRNRYCKCYVTSNMKKQNEIKNLIESYVERYDYQEFTKQEFKLFLAVFADDIEEVIKKIWKK